MAHNKYPARFLSAYDGDTVNLMVELWPDIAISVKLRLNGIDTPERRTRKACEKEMALTVKTFLEEFLAGKQLYITDVFHGKYAGRIIGDLYADDIDVSLHLLSLGYAIPYAGGKRDHIWCIDNKL